MQIEDWKPSTMTEVYQQIRALGLESNIAELETFGFTVIEPEKTGAAKDFASRLLKATMAVAEAEDEAAVALNSHDNKPAFGRQLFHLINKNPIFVDAVMNPAVQAMAKYMMGASYRLYSMVAFLKEGDAKSTLMHSDSSGVPPPLPFYGNVCNISWVLTDYTKENGTLCMVPGSHRLCRHPTQAEHPKFMGGQADDSVCVPIVAKPGSLAIFHGNTWHGTYPKVDEGLRVHVATALCRNYVNPGEDFSDLPEEATARGGAEFARAVGKSAWQGFRAEGPKLERLGSVYGAQTSAFS